jgi:hypothetical protein
MADIKGYIYAICSHSRPEIIYIGSTVLDPQHRFKLHKNYCRNLKKNTKSNLYNELRDNYDDFYSKTIEEVAADTSKTITQIEGDYINKFRKNAAYKVLNNRNAGVKSDCKERIFRGSEGYKEYYRNKMKSNYYHKKEIAKLMAIEI